MTELQSLQDVICQWADAQFGLGREPSAVIAHLKKEVIELDETPNDLMEYADCFILLLQAAKLAGYDTYKLMDAAFTKHEINKNRKWGALNPDGSVEHVEEG